MSNDNGKPAIRFAALIRVSTERQAEEGESLRTQKTEIEHAVEQLGGTVKEWYGGQEHATPGWEKKEVNRLLNDAAKTHRPFDAVIVCHADRWSRDNDASRQGLEVFKQHRIRFFVLTTEHDLFQPEARLFLAMSAAFGHFQAANQSRKSLINRIARARRGVPTCGKLPFGRTFDKQTGQWGIDGGKQRIMMDVARRYLAGESMPSLAEEYCMNHAALHKTLTQRCADKWEQTFDSDELNIHEKVPVSIPRLLPEHTIKAVLARVAANKTFEHGQTKNKYLLSRMVFCADCGYAMFGQTNRGDRRYYRHAHSKRERSCGSCKGWVPAELPEDAVLRHLFNTFGNPAKVEQAIERAVPNLDAARQLQSRITELDDSIKKATDGRQRVIRLVARGATTEEEAAKELEALREKTNRLRDERERLSDSMAHAPTSAEVKDTAKRIASKFKRVPVEFARAIAASGSANAYYSRMTWHDKHDLLKRVFSGKTQDGKRAGVYVEWPDGRAGKCSYTITGLLIRSGEIPMDEGTAETLVDVEYANAGHQKEVLTKSAWR